MGITFQWLISGTIRILCSRIICNYNVLPKTQTFIFNAILFTISMWNKFIVYHEQIYINNSLPFKVFHLITLTICYKIFFKSCGSKLAYHFKIAQYRAEIGRIHYSTVFTSWCPIKCNITKKKIKHISTNWVSSAISYSYIMMSKGCTHWSRHSEVVVWIPFFFNAYAIAPFLIINFRKRIQLTCIELILECFGFSPYLVYFSFSLFIGHCFENAWLFWSKPMKLIVT